MPLEKLEIFVDCLHQFRSLRRQVNPAGPIANVIMNVTPAENIDLPLFFPVDGTEFGVIFLLASPDLS